TDIRFIDMIKLARLGFESNTSGIVSEQLPPTHLLREERIGGADVITVDRNALQQFIQEKFSESANDNASGEDGSNNGSNSAGSSSVESGVANVGNGGQ